MNIDLSQFGELGVAIQNYIDAEFNRRLELMENSDDELLTAKQVAEILNITVWAVGELNRTNKLKGVQTGKRRWRWRKSVVMEFKRNGVGVKLT